MHLVIVRIMKQSLRNKSEMIQASVLASFMSNGWDRYEPKYLMLIHGAHWYGTLVVAELSGGGQEFDGATDGIEKYTLASMSTCVYTCVYALGRVKGWGGGGEEEISVGFLSRFGV